MVALLTLYVCWCLIGGFGLVVGLVVCGVGWYLVSYCWFDVLLRFVDKLLILFVVWCWLFALSCVWV